MARGKDTRNHPNRQVGRPNPSNSGGVSSGTYLGNVGDTHMFSAESTGGGETDSHSFNSPKGYTATYNRGQKYAWSTGSKNMPV